jgi:hypothetical protein
MGSTQGKTGLQYLKYCRRGKGKKGEGIWVKKKRGWSTQHSIGGEGVIMEEIETVHVQYTLYSISYKQYGEKPSVYCRVQQGTQQLTKHLPVVCC